MKTKSWKKLKEHDRVMKDHPMLELFHKGKPIGRESDSMVLFKKTRRGGAMEKKIVILLGFLVFFISPDPILADCASIRYFSGWVLEGSHTISIYSGTTPAARLDVPYCTIRPDSNVRLMKNYYCDGDKIIIDGESCLVSSVRPSALGGY